MKFESPNLNFPRITHGFFTREGGVSTGIYSSMNCAFSSGDERENVEENRARIANILRLTTTRHLITLSQVHSNTTHCLTAMHRLEEVRGAEGDAIVTNLRNIALGILTADCAPVLLADPNAGVIGAAHAGWKGAISGVIQNTVEAMRALGARTIHAAVGPCIAQESYEVGMDFVNKLTEKHPYADRFFATGKNGLPHFDLKGFIHHQLLKAKVENSHILPDDTYRDEKHFFSYRRKTHKNEPDYGRQISCICLL